MMMMMMILKYVALPLHVSRAEAACTEAKFGKASNIHSRRLLDESCNRFRIPGKDWTTIVTMAWETTRTYTPLTTWIDILKE